MAPDLVPVVDLASSDAARRVDDACRSVGFLAVSGHGVPGDVVARMLEAVDAFFALPLETKLRCRPKRAEVDRGYAAMGSEALTYSLGAEGVPPDLFEAFNIGPEGWDPGDAVRSAEVHRFFAPNIWPDVPEARELRPAFLNYFDEIQKLAHRITRVFAEALGLEPDFFESRTDHSTDTMRVNHYERGASEPEPVPGQQRMGAHTDYGIVTVLYADAVPGLQILSPRGEWHDVMSEPGTFLVNLGDLLAEWTNDRWRSTLHRVVPPPREVPGPVRRRSVAFFHDGNYDALIEVLPTCCSEDDPPRYPPVRAGDHLIAKLLGPRTLSASEGMSTVGGRLPGP